MKTTFAVTLLLVSLLASAVRGQVTGDYRTDGTILGGVVGAVTGGAIGNNSGRGHNGLPGALIGGAVGALAGAAVGDSVDTKNARQQAAYQQQVAVQNQLAQAVTVPDVLSMTQARLSDSVIITQIRTRGVAARPQSGDLIALSQAGVSEAVIAAMQTAPLATVTVPGVTTYPRVVERVYVAPAYPPPYYYYGPRYYYPPPPRPHGPPGPGVHWGVSFGR